MVRCVVAGHRRGRPRSRRSPDPVIAQVSAAPSAPVKGALVPSRSSDILADLPKSIYGGFDALALSNGARYTPPRRLTTQTDVCPTLVRFPPRLRRR